MGIGTEMINVVAGIYQPYDYESITVSSTAIGFTLSKYKPSGNALENDNRPAMRVLLTVETNTIRYRVDGTDPTAAEGHSLGSGDVLTLVGPDAISQFRAIAAVGDGTIRVTYER